MWVTEVKRDTIVCSKKQVFLDTGKKTLFLALDKDHYEFDVLETKYDAEGVKIKVFSRNFSELYYVLTKKDRNGLIIFISNAEKNFPSFVLSTRYCQK